MNKFENGLRTLKPLAYVYWRKEDNAGNAFKALGCFVSGFPADYNSEVYSNRWELFDPEKVEDPSTLTGIWEKVYEMHNRPNMKDCRDLRYRYVHVPIYILPQYPHVPCRGIFGLTDRSITISQIKSSVLIHIGNEFE